MFTAVCENTIRGKGEYRGSSCRHLFAISISILSETHLHKLVHQCWCVWVSYSTSTSTKTTETRRDRRARADHIEFEKFPSRLVQLKKHSSSAVLCDPCFNSTTWWDSRQGYISRKGLRYEQFTVLSIVIISHNELKWVKVYGEDALFDTMEKDWGGIRVSAEGE